MCFSAADSAVHLCHPASPGFNTLIFGLNLRGSGFHYHQAPLSANNLYSGDHAPAPSCTRIAHARISPRGIPSCAMAQDADMGLKQGAKACAPKNAPLLKEQPVVTSVFYQSPQDDSGKEAYSSRLSFSHV